MWIRTRFHSLWKPKFHMLLPIMQCKQTAYGYKTIKRPIADIMQAIWLKRKPDQHTIQCTNSNGLTWPEFSRRHKWMSMQQQKKKAKQKATPVLNTDTYLCFNISKSIHASQQHALNIIKIKCQQHAQPRSEIGRIAKFECQQYADRNRKIFCKNYITKKCKITYQTSWFCRIAKHHIVLCHLP